MMKKQVKISVYLTDKQWEMLRARMDEMGDLNSSSYFRNLMLADVRRAKKEALRWKSFE